MMTFYGTTALYRVISLGSKIGTISLSPINSRLLKRAAPPAQQKAIQFNFLTKFLMLFLGKTWNITSKSVNSKLRLFLF